MRVSELLGRDVLPVTSRIQFLPDAGHRLTTEAVAVLTQGWQQLDEANLGFTPDTYWYRLKLENDTGAPQSYQLAVNYQLLDYVALTILDARSLDTVAHFVSGDDLPYEARTIRLPQITFPLSLEPHKDYLLLLQVTTTSTMQVPVELWQPEALATRQFWKALLIGAGSGAILVMALYYLFLWMTLRESSYLFGGLCLAGYSLVQASLTEIGSVYLWPSLGEWNQISPVVTGSVSLAGLALFTQGLLSLGRHSPWLAKLFIAYAVGCLVFACAAFWLPYQSTIQVLILLVVIIPLSTYLTGIYTWRYKGVSEARFFVMGLTVFNCFALLLVLSKLSIIPHSSITEYAIHVGAVISTTCMSLALADRVNQEKAAREQAQQSAISNLEKYRDIFENSLEGLFQVDFSGRLLAANPAMARLLGADSPEALLAKISTLQNFVPAKPDAFQEIVSQFCSLGQVKGLETECCRLDGQTFWASVHARKIEHTSHETGIIEGSIVDISERKNSERRLSYLASHDPLTGLLNRLELEQRLTDTLNHARSNDEHHALLLMDLDQFKIVNDTGGHGAGDELLRQIAQLFRQYTRASDAIARIGGDEFVILLQNCTLENAESIAQKLRQEITNFRLVWADRVHSVGVSIGVVGIHGQSPSMAEVVSMADTACYTAKERGRNRVVVHHEQSDDIPHRQSEMELVSVMREAIRNDELVLFYQKVSCLNCAHDTGDRYEILVRMQHQGKLLAPGFFLPAAERYNLITQLDRWVINACFRWLAQHPDALARLTQANINLSGQSVGDPEFASFIMSAFDEFGIPAHKICFEITESAAISSLAETRTFINRIRELGAHFALDDFGSGFSSYGYLKNLPVSSIKIDGSFIRNILSDPIDFEMVRSMTEVAHIMGLHVVAEYVENEEILSRLRELGVDMAQGWHLHEPEQLSSPD